MLIQHHGGVAPAKAQEWEADRDAWLVKIIRSHEKAILRLCCVYLRDISLAEDAVQETFIKAYNKMDTFRGESSERTWLIRIAINVCKDMQRSAWLRFRETAVDWERLEMPDHRDLADSIALTTAIMNLPERYRKVVYLMYDEGLTGAETARALRVSQATVKRWLEKALKMMRKELDAAKVREGGSGL